MPAMSYLQNIDISESNGEIRRHLLQLVVLRPLVLLFGLNLADRLGLFPDYLGSLPFVPFFNVLALLLTIALFVWWRSGRLWRFQLYFQIGADLILTTILVAYTRGVESAFVSFYLLIIIYCSLTLGHNGGKVGATLSTILYAGIIAADGAGLSAWGAPSMDIRQTTFRISAHVLGFCAVAYLGAYLHRRLRVMEGELKEKIDSLTELQRLNEHIVRSIRSGLITTDLKGRIAVFNAAASELTGRDAQQMMDKPVQSLIGEEFWTRILEEDLLRNAKPLRHEEWISMPNGDRRFLGFSVSPLLDQNRQSLGFIISFQDLTEIIRLEEEVRLKDRMAAIGRMAAAIAHEIRNPLTAMQGSVEILRTRAKLPDKDGRLLDILIKEGDRLNKFVGDFLNFAKPGTYAKQSIDLVSVLRDSVTLLRNSPEIRDRYSVNLNIEAPSMQIWGNADQLNQVFWNLAQNAVRAMPNGGELNIRMRKADGGIGEVMFQDNGIGMSREEKERIFQPFQSGFSGGLGLGLSIIFRIMEDHRAKISFESEKGKGTKVSLRFPLESRPPVLQYEEQTA